MRFEEPTLVEEAEWEAWVASCPPVVRAIAERFDQWSLYRLKSTGQRVVVISISEDGTLCVGVLARFNFLLNERAVPGIDPNDLEPCELPAANELVGALLTPKQVVDNLDAMRVLVRPDLWVMSPDGKAVRKQ